MKLNTIFYAGLLMSSVDSFPLFASISTYAPYISVLLFFIYYVLAAKDNFTLRFSNRRLAVLVLLCLIWVISLIKGLYIYHEISGFISFTIQLLIAVILYKSFSCYFLRLSKDNYTETFAQLFTVASIPILAFGVIELLMFPFKGVYSSMVSMFSWRVTPERLQLASGEPAWASRFLLTLLTLIPLANYKKKKVLFLTCISFILLLATGSTLGFVCVAIYYLITYFNRKYIVQYILAGILMLILVPVIYVRLNDYTKARIELLSQLNSSDIETLAVSAGSGSVMARLGNPVLAAHMGLDNLLLGVGGGYYYYHHYDYLENYFPNALKIKNVYETGTTAKNLVARVFAETGLLGLIPLLYALLWLYKHKVCNNNLLRGVYVTMLLLTLNFDTLFHIYPLLLFCFLLNFTNTKNEGLFLCK